MNVLFSCDREEENKENFLKDLKKIFSNVEYISNYIPSKAERTIFFKLIRGLRKKIYNNNLVNRIYNKICRNFYLKKLDKYNNQFDYFLTISKEFSPEFLKDLKERNPQIKTILYIWDKLEYTSHRNSYKFYDYVFTFDKGDAETYNFIFRPTFFLDYFRDNLKKYEEREYDLYYIGQIREEKRIKIIEEFHKVLKNKKMNIFIKLFKDRKNKKIEINKEILLEEKISYRENIKKMKNSKVTIDISYKNQKGLTLRCFEALATETKIITDNSDIVNYDFYNSENIFYLEEINKIIDIPSSFFIDEYKKVDENIIKRYSVIGFLEDIFNYVKNV